MTAPTLSILVAAYRSERTIARSLETFLAQTYAPREVVVVDSSPDERTASVVRGYPEVRLIRSPERLLPFAARNRAVEAAAGDLLLFTDPDVYAAPAWAERLVAAHADGGGVVVGAVSCHGSRWLDVGAHLCKYDSWLPSGRVRPIDVGPTTGLLVDRRTLALVDGFREDTMLGDAVLCWELEEVGVGARLVPDAIVEHDHAVAWTALLRERYARGYEYAVHRGRLLRRGAGRRAWDVAAAASGLRLARLVLRSGANARRAAQGARFAATLPVVASAHAAWLAGELARELGRRQPGPR